MIYPLDSVIQPLNNWGLVCVTVLHNWRQALSYMYLSRGLPIAIVILMLQKKSALMHSVSNMTHIRKLTLNVHVLLLHLIRVLFSVGLCGGKKS